MDVPTAPTIILTGSATPASRHMAQENTGVQRRAAIREHRPPPRDPGGPQAPAPVVCPDALPAFHEIYDTHFDFVWRSARRLGVAESSLEDVVQDSFLTAYRRLDSFEGRSSLRTWLFGILLRTVRDHRRRLRRKPSEPLQREPVADVDSNPLEHAARAQAARVVQAVLDGLDEARREVFVMAELEQLSAPEIADALGINVNTVYSRLRAARKAFDSGVQRHQERDQRRIR